MSASSKLRHEFKALGLAMAFFGAWIGLLILIKTLLLEGYHIDFVGWSKIVVGALVLSKVVLVLEHVSLGAWIRSQSAWVDILVRTLLYAAGLVAVLLLEHGLKERHEAGGFVAAITDGFLETNAQHLLVNAICLSGALFFYNVLAVVNLHLGAGGVLRLLKSPMSAESRSASEQTHLSNRPQP